jgi:adenylate cyclase
VTAIEPTITAAEVERAKRKPPESLGAHDFYLRALPYLYDLSRGTFQTAAHLLREAVRLDPSYADALAALAHCLGRSAIGGWLDYHDVRAEARDLARAAILADPDHGGALAHAAWVLAILDGQHEQAIEVAERALRVHPNSAYVRGQCGWVFLYSGQIERAAEQFEAGLRLNPLDPRARVLTVGLAAGHFFAWRFDDAVRWCRRTLSASPDDSVARRYLAASLAYLGRREEAQGAIQELLTRQPNSCLSRSRSSSAFAPTWMLELYVDGLKLAGLPE